MYLEELRGVLEGRGQDTTGHTKPRLQKKFLSEKSVKDKTPVSSPSASKKRALMPVRALKLKWSREEVKRKKSRPWNIQCAKCPCSLRLRRKGRREKRQKKGA